MGICILKFIVICVIYIVLNCKIMVFGEFLVILFLYSNVLI